METLVFEPIIEAYDPFDDDPFDHNSSVAELLPETVPEADSQLESLAAAFDRYRASEVVDGSRLDELVGEVEAQLMDLQFQERWEEWSALAAAAHAMCGPQEAAAFARSDYLSSHTHDHAHEREEAEDEGDDEDENEALHRTYQSRGRAVLTLTMLLQRIGVLSAK